MGSPQSLLPHRPPPPPPPPPTHTHTQLHSRHTYHIEITGLCKTRYSKISEWVHPSPRTPTPSPSLHSESNGNGLCKTRYSNISEWVHPSPTPPPTRRPHRDKSLNRPPTRNQHTQPTNPTSNDHKTQKDWMSPIRNRTEKINYLSASDGLQPNGCYILLLEEESFLY